MSGPDLALACCTNPLPSSRSPHRLRECRRAPRFGTSRAPRREEGHGLPDEQYLGGADVLADRVGIMAGPRSRRGTPSQSQVAVSKPTVSVIRRGRRSDRQAGVEPFAIRGARVPARSRWADSARATRRHRPRAGPGGVALATRAARADARQTFPSKTGRSLEGSADAPEPRPTRRGWRLAHSPCPRRFGGSRGPRDHESCATGPNDLPDLLPRSCWRSRVGPGRGTGLPGSAASYLDLPGDPVLSALFAG